LVFIFRQERIGKKRRYQTQLMIEGEKDKCIKEWMGLKMNRILKE
jgi:hypothetical protein